MNKKQITNTSQDSISPRLQYLNSSHSARTDVSHWNIQRGKDVEKVKLCVAPAWQLTF